VWGCPRVAALAKEKEKALGRLMAAKLELKTAVGLGVAMAQVTGVGLVLLASNPTTQTKKCIK
jgi:hypothetical protein